MLWTPAAQTRQPAMDEGVLDASALVNLLLDNELGAAVQRRIAGHPLHAPAHLDAEVLSARRAVAARRHCRTG
jgi:predicted nucleic acid-binding protein